MPRKSRPNADPQPAAVVATGGIPETHPHDIVRQVADALALPGDAAEPATSPPAATDFAPPAEPKRPFVWARIEGTADRPVGIKVETETERQPGIAHPRVLIRFRDDVLPTRAEKHLLQQEGFKFCPDAMAWGRQKSAAALVVAKRVAGALAKDRGDEGAGLYL